MFNYRFAELPHGLGQGRDVSVPQNKGPTGTSEAQVICSAHHPHPSPLFFTVSAFCSSLSCDINEGHLLIILFPYDPLGKLRSKKRSGTAGRRKCSQGMDT